MLNWLRWREHYRPDNSQFLLSGIFLGSGARRRCFQGQALEFKEHIGLYVVPMQTLFMQCYVSTYSYKAVAYRFTLLKKQFTAEKFEVFENYYF